MTLKPFNLLAALLLSAAFWLAGLSPALAWNKAGHMVSGAIAYSELQQIDPAATQQVVSSLRQHPEFESRWADLLEGRSEDEQALYLFMLAARWSDDIRGNPQYDRPTWHYVNIPYRPDRPFPSEEPIGDGELPAALGKNLEMASGGGSEANQAIALCWLFHLVGDAHQPLHSTTFISDQYPEGDRGGTRFYVRATPTARTTISLHKYWDDLIIGSRRFQSARNRAIELRSRPEHQRDELPELAAAQFEEWIEESYTLSVEQVYQNGTLNGSTDREDGIALPLDYATTAKPTAERRIVLAGYRLADWLQENF